MFYCKELDVICDSDAGLLPRTGKILQKGGQPKTGAAGTSHDQWFYHEVTWSVSMATGLCLLCLLLKDVVVITEWNGYFHFQQGRLFLMGIITFMINIVYNGKICLFLEKHMYKPTPSDALIFKNHIFIVMTLPLDEYYVAKIENSQNQWR